jgi:sigma-E factor negative regulatory protein RseA
MSKETREHLSSLVDGEISRETSRFLVRRLGVDEELSATWTRYHLIRDCLRHPEGGMAGEDLSARVSAALEEDAAATPVRRRKRAWLKPAAGFAIAASVALMAVVGVTPRDVGTAPVDGNLAEQAPVQPFTSPQGLSRVPGSSAASLLGGGQEDSRMNAYLLRHYQATGSTGGKGFVTFVPIVVNTQAADATADTSIGEDEESFKDNAREEQSR